MTTHAFGRRVHHDPASRAYPAAVAPVLQDVQHQHAGPVLDQGNLGSCTGNAAAQALNTTTLYDGKRRLLTEQDAVGIYSWATHHDGLSGVYPPDDSGSSGLGAAKALKHLGLISAYRHAFGLRHALGALVLAPVIIGTAWTDTMENPDKDGTIHYRGDVVGGHETCLIGIDTVREQVIGLNSWSDQWGDQGRYRLSFDDLGALLAEQGDATVLVAQPDAPSVIKAAA